MSRAIHDKPRLHPAPVLERTAMIGPHVVSQDEGKIVIAQRDVGTVSLTSREFGQVVENVLKWGLETKSQGDQR